MRIQLSGNWISKYWKFPLLYHSHFTLPNILLDLSQHMLADAEHIAEAFAAHIDPADVPLPEAASCLLLGDHTILKVGNTRHRAIHVNQRTRECPNSHNHNHSYSLYLGRVCMTVPMAVVTVVRQTLVVPLRRPHRHNESRTSNWYVTVTAWVLQHRVADEMEAVLRMVVCIVEAQLQKLDSWLAVQQE